MDKIRKYVLEIMEELEKLSERDYRTFELALALFLRSDKYIAECLSNKELEDLDREIYNSEYFMSDDLRDYIDSVLDNY